MLACPIGFNFVLSELDLHVSSFRFRNSALLLNTLLVGPLTLMEWITQHLVSVPYVSGEQFLILWLLSCPTLAFFCVCSHLIKNIFGKIINGSNYNKKIDNSFLSTSFLNVGT